MAQALTLTVGALAWWFAAGEMDSRYTMGVGGPALYLGLWLFVVALLVRRERLRAIHPDRAAFARPWSGSATGLAVGVICVALVSFALQILNVADALTGVIFGTILCAILALVSAPVIALARTAPTSTVAPAAPPTALLVALAPLLCPVLAMFALRASAVAGPWAVETASAGRAGILYYASVSLWLPTAALVAWGIDRLDGSRGGRLASLFAGATLATLASAIAWLPALLTGLATRSVGESGFGLGYGNALAYWRPFGTPSGRPVDDWLRATAAMMLAAGIASTLALRALGRSRTIGSPVVTAGVLIAQCVASRLLLPRTVPAAAAWIAAGAALILAFVNALPARKTRASVVTTGVPAEDVKPPPGDTTLSTAPA